MKEIEQAEVLEQTLEERIYELDQANDEEGLNTLITKLRSDLYGEPREAFRDALETALQSAGESLVLVEEYNAQQEED